MFRFWPEILAGICIGLCPFEHLFAYIWELNSWKSCKFHPISKLRRVALRTKWTRHERTRKRRRSNGSKQLQLYELVRHCWSFAWEAYLCGQFKGRCCGFNPLSPAWIYLDSVSYHLGPPNLAIVLGVCLSWRYFYLLDLWRLACWSILHKHLHRLDQGIRIYLNCGDHGHIADAIIAKLQVGICLVWSCKMFRFESIFEMRLPSMADMILVNFGWVHHRLLPHLLMTRDSCWQREFFVAKVRRPYPWIGTKSPAVRAQCNSARRRP